MGTDALTPLTMQKLQKHTQVFKMEGAEQGKWQLPFCVRKWENNECIFAFAFICIRK